MFYYSCIHKRKISETSQQSTDSSVSGNEIKQQGKGTETKTKQGLPHAAVVDI